jgi:general L-amino acid transport system substrate-binding protein
VLFTLINAEVAAIGDVGAMRRFAVQTEALARRWQLHPGWLDIVLNDIGHYGDMYSRNLGVRSPLNLPRSNLNRPSRNGGGQFAAP